MVDSHCHIAGEEFAIDLDAVIERAQQAGVSGALVILSANDAAELERAAGVVERWSGVRVAVGVHPHAAGGFASDPAAAAARVEGALDSQPMARALGEIGLDYHYDFAPRAVQQAVFREQIRAARRRELPIVIHTREATDDTFAIMREEAAADIGGVFHCFTGDWAMAERALDIGFHLSLSGIVTFPRALALQDVARRVPLERLLIETDSPFLAPAPFRGKRNEPAYVSRVAAAVAELRGTASAHIADVTAQNYFRLFNP